MSAPYHTSNTYSIGIIEENKNHGSKLQRSLATLNYLANDFFSLSSFIRKRLTLAILTHEKKRRSSPLPRQVFNRAMLTVSRELYIYTDD